jgi:hypothetical protein
MSFDYDTHRKEICSGYQGFRKHTNGNPESDDRRQDFPVLTSDKLLVHGCGLSPYTKTEKSSYVL